MLRTCRAGRRTRSRNAVIWPAEVRRWLRDYPVAAVPSLHPDCRESAPPQPPLILTPKSGAVALLVPGMAADDQEMPLRADAAGTDLAWFVDGRFLGSVAADEVVWWRPEPGLHTVGVQDDSGHADRIQFEVRAGRAARIRGATAGKSTAC